MKDRYAIKRGGYASLSEADISKFESILEKHRVLTGDETQGFNIDWIGSVRGNSNVVLKPRTTEEVSEIMKYCHSRKLAVCPQSGNTGLVKY
jgi:FAD/FMN-containing dehydrogenase